MALVYLIRIQHIHLYKISVGAFIMGRKIPHFCNLHPGEKENNNKK